MKFTFVALFKTTHAHRHSTPPHIQRCTRVSMVFSAPSTLYWAAEGEGGVNCKVSLLLKLRHPQNYR